MRAKHEEEEPAFLSYRPDRHEYFVARILQGLVTGRAERDLKGKVQLAVIMADELEKELDS